jgi:hypothetical protein
MSPQIERYTSSVAALYYYVDGRDDLNQVLIEW